MTEQKPTPAQKADDADFLVDNFAITPDRAADLVSGDTLDPALSAEESARHNARPPLPKPVTAEPEHWDDDPDTRIK